MWGRASALPPGFRPAWQELRNFTRQSTILPMRFYERRLPHWDVVGKRVFVTFRLYGSLPAGRIFPPARMSAGEVFVAMDRILDRGEHGPVYLKRPEIAGMVMTSILDGDRRFRRYDLHAFVIMSNHVHILVTSLVRMAEWTRSLKGFTGREASKMLGLNGTPFWLDESYDRLLRNDEEFRNTKRYIEWNPVKVGLADSPEGFPWSSATPGGSPAAGRKP
jgi:REP element-mobilizing transposase RayT